MEDALKDKKIERLEELVRKASKGHTDKSNALLWAWSNPLEKWVPVVLNPDAFLVQSRCERDLTVVRHTANGLVAAGPQYLYWLTFNPAGGGAVLGLTDAVEAGVTLKWDFLGEKTGGNHLNFDPPIKFSTGIFIEAFNEVRSAIFGYCD